MIRILLDTNVILDVALKRKPHFETSSKIFSYIDDIRLKGHVTATTLTDIYYIFKKVKGNKLAIEFLSNLIKMVAIIGVDKSTVLDALHSNIIDFEDAIQVSAAKQSGLRVIVTRNKSDFKNASLEVYSPAELLNLLAD